MNEAEAADPLSRHHQLGMGNRRSVEQALRRVGARTPGSPATMTSCVKADGLLLPGVGAFPAAMRVIGELEPG